MEKFGEKLAKDRPVECGNAEGIYYVAYATLMLQTSVHNPQAVKMKMTLADFRKITTGTKINDSSSTETNPSLGSSFYDELKIKNVMPLLKRSISPGNAKGSQTARVFRTSSYQKNVK